MKNQRSSRAKQWDRKARAFGFRDERDWRHQLRVRRLRELLRRMPIRPDSYMFRSIIAIKGYLPAHPDLFTVREVADAIGASAKVIRKAARGGMIKFRRLPGQNARKLFFELAAVRQFKDRFRPGDNLRSEKIALNPHFRQGDAVTIDRAMVELGLSRRGVQYYLSQGVLKKIPCGHRTVLITKKSLAGLSWRRLAQPERQFNAAKKRLEKITRFWPT
jgi:hypothetical protein